MFQPLKAFSLRLANIELFAGALPLGGGVPRILQSIRH